MILLADYACFDRTGFDSYGNTAENVAGPSVVPVAYESGDIRQVYFSVHSFVNPCTLRRLVLHHLR